MSGFACSLIYMGKLAASILNSPIGTKNIFQIIRNIRILRNLHFLNFN